MRLSAESCVEDGSCSDKLAGSVDNPFGDVMDSIEELGSWEVIFGGMVKVRESKDFDADIVATVSKCTIFRGRQEGGWVKRVGAPGYVSIMWQDIQLIKKSSVKYIELRNGTCESSGLSPILELSACEAAAVDLNLLDVTASPAASSDRPYGCYFADMAGLFVAAEGDPSAGGSKVRSVICSSARTCKPTTTTTTTQTTSTTTTKTTSTSTTTSTTWGSPSLFCWAVVRPWGYEPGLVQEQYNRGAAIFNCDQYAVLSSGKDVKLAGIEVREIPNADPSAGTGDLTQNGVTTNSWLNTWIFIQAWTVILKEEPALDHDWTVKVDPDAVFFPERLRFHVREHTPEDGSGDSLYVMNCNRNFGGNDGGAKLFGSLEVFSKKAMQTYLDSEDRCQKELNWKGWGEDYFMSHCLDHVGVGRVEDFGMLSDKRCWQTECSDTWKVAFHDFKDENSYFECWEASLGADGVKEYAARVAERAPQEEV